MSRDFAKKTPKKKKPSASRAKAKESKPLPGWIWFVCGVIVTVFFQFLLHLAQKPIHQSNVQQKPQIEWPKENIEPTKPQLSFYQTLKKQDVKVGDEVVQDRDDGAYAFSLQVGSFKQNNDAEQLRAELILKGYDANIQKTTNAQNNVWYRVIVGPFNSRSLFAKTRGRLLDDGIRPIRVKAK